VIKIKSGTIDSVWDENPQAKFGNSGITKSVSPLVKYNFLAFCRYQNARIGANIPEIHRIYVQL